MTLTRHQLRSDSGVGAKPEFVSLLVQEPADPELVLVQLHRIRYGDCSFS